MNQLAEQTNQAAVVDLPHAVTLKALKVALSFSAKNDIRYYLNGVLIEFVAGKMNIVATDGHTLLLVPVSVSFIPEALLDKQFILERAGVELLGKAISAKIAKEDAKLTLRTDGPQDNFLNFTTETEVSQHVSLVDGKYPEYRRVIPNLSNRTLHEPDIGLNVDYLARLSKLKPLLSGVAGVKMTANGANESVVFQSRICGTVNDLTVVIMPMRV